MVAAYMFQPVTHIKMGGGYDAPYLNTYDLAYIDNWAGGFGQIVRFSGGAATGQSDQAAPEAGAGEDQEINGSAQANPAPASPSSRGKEPVQENYRWTRAHPVLFLPGVGQAARLELNAAASPVYSQGQQVTILSNGRTLETIRLLPGAPTLHTVDLGEGERGNYTVEMMVSPVGAANAKVKAPADGIKLYDAWVLPYSGSLLPAPGVAIALALAALGIYWSLAFLGLAKRWAFGVVALLSVAAGAILAGPRLALTIYTWRLALLVLVGAACLLLLDWLLPRLFGRLGISVPTWAVRTLLALFLAGLFLRGGGVLYPQMVVIDAPAHLVEIWRVTQGQLVQEYTNQVLSQMPRQWHSSIVIPYSTISYFLLAPFAMLPLDIHLSINLVNALLDALRVIVVAMLAWGMGAGLRAGLVAAGLYLILPVTWLLNSWGNWPTTLSLWFASLYLALVLLLYRRLASRGVWLALTALLTLTMLVYTTTAVFMVALLGIWAGGLFFFAGRKDPVSRRNALLLLGSGATAVATATALYFWQFVPDVLQSVRVAGSTLSGGKSLGVQPTPFGSYLSSYLGRFFIDYGLGILLLAALLVVGWALFSRYSGRREASGAASPPPPPLSPSGDASPVLGGAGGEHVRWLVGAWLAVFVLFSLVGWKVDMVDKQVWFIVPLVCALAGMALVRAWRAAEWPLMQYGARLAVTALTAWLVYASAGLWIYRIFVKRH
jgi:hypothetical protein